jgi:hypothetical protein
MVSPFVRLFEMSQDCNNSQQATKKDRGEWQDYFLLFGNIFEKPTDHAQLHFETTPAEIKPIPRIRCDVAPPTWGIAISTDS